MRKTLKSGWKRICAMILSAAMLITMIPANVMAETSSDRCGTFDNPVIYSDVPDIDIIRVEDTYYMVSTTMHLSPGCPIMKSTDLVNWEIVNYVFDTLGTDDAMSLRNGEDMYGNGQWATSLQYHNGKYYAAFNSNTTGTVYIFTTDDIEHGSWTRTTLDRPFHDMALFFDNDKAYILYGSMDIKYVELKEDLSGVKEGEEGTLLFSSKNDGEAVQVKDGLFEGTHIMKKDGYYYVFNISWPSGRPRLEVCHRSKTFPSTEWESKVILEADFQNNGVSGGVAQGGVIDTADGKWYGFLFQDHGAVGRVPVLTDCTWIDGWPMLGKDGDGKTVESVMELPVSGSDVKSIVKSDEFYNDAEHRVYETDATKAAQTLTATETDQKVYAAEEAEAKPQTETVELITNGDFESGTDGWQTFESCENILVTPDDGSESNQVLQVTGRKNTSSSAMYDLSGKLEKDTTYTISGKIKYTAGPDTKNFNVMFQNGVDYRYRSQAGSITADKGEWKDFSIDYVAGDKVDGDTTYEFSNTQNYFFIETPWAASPTAEDDLMDYYLEDISITYQKTTEGGTETGGEESAENLIQLFTNGDAETGTTEGWTTTPGETAPTLAATGDESYSGNYSLCVSNRQSMGAGACQDISGKMVWGKTYTISGKLKYTTGPDTKQFFVTIQNGPDYNYRSNLISITAKKGEWVEFTGTYTPADKSEEYPFDAEHNYIFVETPWAASIDQTNDLMDYYLDDFSMTTTEGLPGEMISDGSFKNGLGAWESFGKVEKLELAEEGYDDSSSMKVTGRTAGWQGPTMDFTGKMTRGNTYTLTAYVKYDDGNDQDTITATIKGGEGDSTTYTTMASAVANKGEWTKMTGEWTMPEDASDIQVLYFNTGSTTMDFYVDNVSMIEKVNDAKETAISGENDYNGSDLDLVWQWNHNPNNLYWSLTARSGWLRLTTGNKATSILNARNTLTQRTYGPACSGKIKMDISNMKTGDVAGLGAFSYNYGYIAVKKENDGAKLIMVDASGNSAAGEDNPVVKESADCDTTTVYLKEEFNFAGNEDGSDKDTVSFYYSFDGKTWTKLGDTMRMTYELNHFMGSRFAIFNYATKNVGGYVDYDYFRVSDSITGADQTSGDEGKAAMTGTPEISGVINSECEVKLSMDELAAAKHSSLKASISVPENMSVKEVVFNTAAIKGETDYTYKNHRLTLTVKGSDISFAAEDKLFATIKLKMNGYVSEDKTVSVKADYITVDNGKSEYDVTDCAASILQKYLDTGALAKKLGYGNPIMTQEFGADPYAIVYNGRVYVYMTADDYEYDADGNLLDNSFSYIKTLRVVSSSDMVNWTDHGEIAVAGENGAAKWASLSWAPAIAYKQIDGKDKFFLYFANGGGGIGVLEADTPLGPWEDPVGQALLTHSSPGCEGVPWMFDPAVLVDDDGSAYLYFGGGVPEGQELNPKSARVAKLGDDMISIEGTPQEIDAPCMFEDSGIFKFGDKYYYSYCSNFSGVHGEGYPGYGTICYMVSDDPMGPFEYAGEIFENPSVWFNVGGNNHHATFVFEGKSYFIYHAQTVSKEEGKAKGYRSTHIDKIDLNSDGTIKPIAGTYEGISQLHEMNPYERIDAETIAWNAGVKAEVCSEPGKLFSDYNMSLTNLQESDWTSVSQLNFGENGAKTFEVYAASEKGGKIEVRLDSPDGTLIGTAEVPATGSDKTYQLVSCDVDNVTGTQNVFLVFRGADSENIMNVDYYQFTEKESAPADNTVLLKKLTEAQKLLEKLTGADREALQAAIDAADKVLNKEGVTQEEIDAALTALTQKVTEAEEIIQKNEGNQVDNTKLTAKLAEAEKLLAKLSGSDRDKLQAAIDAAKKILNKEGVTQEEIDVALTALNQKVTDAEKIINTPKEDDLKKYVGKTFTSKNLKYKITKCTEKTKYVTVIGAAKQLTAISIPANVKYNGMTFKVTAIGSKAFKNQKKLTSVTIGKNVTTIKAGAFSGDKKLGKIKFNGTAVKSIGKNAFKNIKKTAVFTMKKTFTFNNLKFKITKCTASVKTVTVTGAAKQLTTAAIPNTVKYNGMTFKVTAIGSKAFKNQKKLKSAVIGKNVKKIGTEAFSGDKKLAKIKFNGTALKSIGKNAFKSIKKSAVFDVKNSKIEYYRNLLKKANTKNFKVK